LRVACGTVDLVGALGYSLAGQLAHQILNLTLIIV
jgi:hypothetical protein